MTLEEFIAAYKLPALVPIKRACEILPCAHSTLYKMHNNGRVVIRKMPSGRSCLTVQELYSLTQSLPAAGSDAA